MYIPVIDYAQPLAIAQSLTATADVDYLANILTLQV